MSRLDPLWRAAGRSLDRAGLKRPINWLRFSITRPPWWLDHQARRRFFRPLIPRGGLCFDIGAHEGESSKFYLELGARVVAVEPQPVCADRARTRLAGRDDCIVLETAVGSRRGRAALWPVAEETQISSMDRSWIESVRRSGRFPDRQWADPIEVEVTTLDALIDEYGTPDFLKIDVEGHEAEVLAGLRHSVPTVSFEFTPEHREVASICLERLRLLGNSRFQLARHFEWRFEWPEPLGIEEARALLARESDGGRGGDVYAFRGPRRVRALSACERSALAGSTVGSEIATPFSDAGR